MTQRRFQHAATKTLRVNAAWVVLVTCAILGGCAAPGAGGQTPRERASDHLGPSIQAAGCTIVRVPFEEESDAVPTAIGVTVLLAAVLRIARRLQRSRAATGRFEISARWSRPDA